MDSSFGVLSVSLRVITFFFLFLLSSVYADTPYAQPFGPFCSVESTLCLLSVDYPLERTHSNYDGCGYPGFEVDCDDNKYEGRPFMNISNHIYLVREVDFGDQTIRLVDIDVEGSGCSQPKQNFSFPSSPSWVDYHLSARNEDNITIFYDCSNVSVDAEASILCSPEDYKSTNTPPSYAFYRFETQEGFDWYGNCAQNVVVPVMDDSLMGLNYSDAIKRGFYMRWSATDWCKDCEGSGGRCWSLLYNNSTGCACKDDNYYIKTCPPDLCIDCESLGAQCDNSICTCKNNKSFNLTCLPQTTPLHRGYSCSKEVG